MRNIDRHREVFGERCWAAVGHFGRRREAQMLIVGNTVLRKENQDPALKLVYTGSFELD